MATQKIGLTKLGLKKNTNIIPLEWNGQIIEIKQYLPIEDKSEVIEHIVNKSLDDNSFANPIRLEINTVLEIMYAYTNINFTDKQKEESLNLYDLLVSSGLWASVHDIMIEYRDFNDIIIGVEKTVNEVNRHKDSLLGILEAVNQDYSNLQFDVNQLSETLTDPNSLSLLRDVVTKLG